MTTHVLVRQEHPDGCAIASLAMVFGESYEDTHAALVAMDERLAPGKLGGLTKTAVDQMLASRGFVWRTLYKAWSDPWPPKPFAPIHIASVVQPSKRGHFVVMLADGTVLDPVEHGTSLDYWPKVNNVTGIWPERAR